MKKYSGLEQVLKCGTNAIIFNSKMQPAKYKGLSQKQINNLSGKVLFMRNDDSGKLGKDVNSQFLETTPMNQADCIYISKEKLSEMRKKDISTLPKTPSLLTLSNLIRATCKKGEVYTTKNNWFLLKSGSKSGVCKSCFKKGCRGCGGGSYWVVIVILLLLFILFLFALKKRN